MGMVVVLTTTLIMIPFVCCQCHSLYNKDRTAGPLFDLDWDCVWWAADAGDLPCLYEVQEDLNLSSIINGTGVCTTKAIVECGLLATEEHCMGNSNCEWNPC